MFNSILTIGNSLGTQPDPDSVEDTATSRSCGTPSATSSNSTMPSGSSKRTAT